MAKDKYNRLYDFTLDELFTIGLAINSIHKFIDENNSPMEFIRPAIDSISDKLKSIIESRVETQENYLSLVESDLLDLQKQSIAIINEYETEKK